VNYDRVQRHANKLIATYGKPATLIRLEQSGPAYNPTTTEVEYTVQIVETGYEIANRADTLVQTGDRVGIISTTGEAPELSDKIEIGGTRYGLVGLEPLTPGATTLAYTFVARR